MRSSTTKGFTLVEVMVALAIVALALPALLVALSSQIDATGYLRDKSLAHVVAENKLAELRLLSRVRQELFKGKESGSEEMAGREWYWWLESAATEVPEFYRVEIDVALDQGGAEEPVYTLVAFLSGDLASLQDDAEVQPGG